MTDAPYLTPDADARALAQNLIAAMQHATLAVVDPASGYPHLSRIAAQADTDGTPMALLSEIALHTCLLEQQPRAGLLVEAPSGARGDAMAQARMSLQVTARRLPTGGPDHAARFAAWIARNPKAKVYAQLPDFHFWRLEPHGGLLNAGFGKSYRLHPDDMKMPPAASGRGH